MKNESSRRESAAGGQSVSALEAENHELRARLAAAEDSLRDLRDRLAADRRGHSADAEEKVRRSEERFAMALQAGQLGFWDWDVVTGHVTFGGAWTQMLGYQPGETPPHVSTWERLVHPDDMQETMRVLTDHLEGRTEFYESEHRLRHKDGSWRWILDRGQVVQRDASGKPLRALGTHSDITERRRAEENLRQSESFYRQTLESIPGMVFTNTPDGMCDYVSSQWAEFTGLPAEQQLGEGWLRVLHPDDRPRAFAAWRAAVEGRGAYDLEYRVRRRDAAYEWFKVRGRAIRDHQGTIVRWFGSALSVEGLKRVEAVLRDSQERLQAALTGSGAGTFRWNLQTNVLEWDENLDRLFGLKPGETIRSLEAFIATAHPEDRPGIIAQCERCAREGTDFDMELRVIWPDGSIHWLYDKGRVLRDPDGKPAYMAGACVDITERKLADMEVRRSNDLLKTIMESTPDLVWAKDREGRVTLANQATFNLLGGGDPARVLGQGARELVPDPKQAQRIMDNDARIMAEGKAEMVEEYFGDPQSPLIFQTIKAPLRDLAGAVVGVVGVSRNMTAVKLAQEELRISEERYRASFDNAAVGIAHVGLDGRWLRFNEAVCRITGYNSDELIKLTFANITHPEDLEKDLAQAHRLLLGEIPTYTMEKRYIRKDGSTVWVNLTGSLLRDSKGEVQSFIAVIQDINDRKIAEQELAYHRGLLQSISDNAQTSIFLMDSAGYGLFVNPAGEQMTGFSRDELVGRILHDVIHHTRPDGSHFPVSECPIDRALPFSESLRGYEDVFVHKDGHFYPVRCNARPVFRDGRPVATVVEVWDVTQEKKAEAALARAQEELKQHAARLEITVAERTSKLQELVGELEHFSYTITHDMRAPLRSMRGFADLVLELCQDPQQQNLLQRIVSSAERMDLLITDALSYSRAVRQDLPLGPVDVGALLRGMLDSYPEFQTSNARIQIEGDLPVVLANQAGLTQCFSNLLGNAVKFVDPGKTPEVRIRAETVQPDNETGTGAPRWARFWVEDNGIGISPTMMPRIFNMFSRGTQAVQGTGIGLALVRKVVDRMGGRVGVESEVGKGSRFWLELQLADAPQRQGSAAGSAMPINPASIL